MNNELFWKLYNSNNISVKTYAGTEDNGTEKEVSAFEHDGKYYLRIVTDFKYILDRTATCGKKFRMCRHNCFFKEFQSRESANNYFKKVVSGMKKGEGTWKQH